MDDARVLVADDDPDVRTLLGTAVRSWGYVPVCVGSGAEAVQTMLASGAPTRAILDWMMPGLSGVDVVRAIRAVHATAEPPYLIVLTARGDSDDAVRALEAGADDYVRKPFDLAELRARLKRGRRVSSSSVDDRVGAGTVLGERWRLASPIGSGGMGDVWSARHVSLGIDVAVTVVKAELSSQPMVRARFETEAFAAAQLRSQHVAQVLDYGVTSGGIAYLVMERLRGETLFQAVRDRGPLPMPVLARVVSHIARGLKATHEAGYIHRDVKPSNVFLATVDEDSLTGLPYQAKLLDFGVARLARGASRVTEFGTFVGTAGYSSPEQLAGGDVDARSDVWSLGMTTFFAATGVVPGPTGPAAFARVGRAPLPVPSETTAGLPPSFDRWFSTACATAPHARFQSAAELARELRKIAGLPRSPSLGRSQPPLGEGVDTLRPSIAPVSLAPDGAATPARMPPIPPADPKTVERLAEEIERGTEGPG